MLQGRNEGIKRSEGNYIADNTTVCCPLLLKEIHEILVKAEQGRGVAKGGRVGG